MSVILVFRTHPLFLDSLDMWESITICDPYSLKGIWHEIFDLRFFHESVSSWPLSILFEILLLYMKIREDIHNFMFIAGVVDTGDKPFHQCQRHRR